MLFILFKMKATKSLRRAGRIKIKHQQTENDQDPKPPSAINVSDFELKERFQRLRQQRNIEEAKETIKNLYGKHNPVLYRPQFNFQENWESTKAESSIDSSLSSWKSGNIIVNSLQTGFIIGYILALWYLSIYRIFQKEDINEEIILITMVVQTGDVIVEELTGNRSQKTESIKLKQKVKKHLTSFLLLIYLCFVVFQKQITGGHSEPLVVIDIFFGVKMYRRLKALYVVMKIRIPSYWRNQIEIAQLVGGCLILVHIFSIVLYLVAETDPKNNWTAKIANFDQSWTKMYIFSLYFACTTMFTVGYGDITPVNQSQILTILIVQVVGIINMGYIINQVGRCLSKINESQQLLYRGISDAEKLSQNYQLPEELSQKLTTYVVNNQIANNRFKVEEEDQFLMKLSDDVRQCKYTLIQKSQVYNNFQLIKTSVFFLCHWTNRFQNNIAKKLIRQVYSPEEILYQVQGKEKIYIISRGKVELAAIFNSKHKSLSKKRLMTIQVKPEKDVHFNVYGYSSMISGLKVNLCAVARDYSICYCVDKESFLNVACESAADLEYYHEIRSKIEESNCKESFEVPKFKNTKEHYQPNVYFVVKRDKKQNKQTQWRKNIMRKNKKSSLCFCNQDLNEDIEGVEKRNKRSSTENVSIGQGMQVQMERQYSGSLKSLQSLNSGSLSGQQSKKRMVLTDFESSRNYSSFRKKCNPEVCIKRYNNKFCKIEEEDGVLQLFFKKTTTGVDRWTEEMMSKLVKTKLIRSC